MRRQLPHQVDNYVPHTQLLRITMHEGLPNRHIRILWEYGYSFRNYVHPTCRQTFPQYGVERKQRRRVWRLLSFTTRFASSVVRSFFRLIMCSRVSSDEPKPLPQTINPICPLDADAVQSYKLVQLEASRTNRRITHQYIQQLATVRSAKNDHSSVGGEEIADSTLQFAGQ